MNVVYILVLWQTVILALNDHTELAASVYLLQYLSSSYNVITATIKTFFGGREIAGNQRFLNFQLFNTIIDKFLNSSHIITYLQNGLQEGHI